MTLPLKTGGTTVTILSEAQGRYGDKVYTDGVTITGCMYFPSLSPTGRISYRAEQTTGGQDIVNAVRTLYLPYATTIGPTDRVLIHPNGVDDPTQLDDAYRHDNTYDVLGEPMFWRNALTGWSPACEVALMRIY